MTAAEDAAPVLDPIPALHPQKRMPKKDSIESVISLLTYLSPFISYISMLDTFSRPIFRAAL
jgi:hypothetical protein